MTYKLLWKSYFSAPSIPPRFSSGGKAESAESGGGARTAVFSQRQRPRRAPAPRCSRELGYSGRCSLKAAWGEAEGVKRGRENPVEEGKSLSVSCGAALCPPPPSSEGEGPVPVMAVAWREAGVGLRHSGDPRLARLAACGAAPVSEEKRRLKSRPSCCSKLRGGGRGSFIPSDLELCAVPNWVM